MHPSSQEETWGQVRALLLRIMREWDRHASGDQSASNDWLHEARGEFNLFLEHNELALAWDTLAEHAENASLSEEGWHTLARAATLMGLQGRSEQAQRHIAKGDCT